MTICAFCSADKSELYTCPQCRVNYCSLKCYRSKEHNECSEKFYQKCVKQELQGKKHDGPSFENFEEEMKKYIQGESDYLPGTSNHQEGEPLDSDDDIDADDYLKKVVEGTMAEYEQDDGEIERRLLATGLSGDIEQLMASLSEEERKYFGQLAEEMQQEELGLGQSCFK